MLVGSFVQQSFGQGRALRWRPGRPPPIDRSQTAADIYSAAAR
jgi:hypothetical protein